MKLSKYHVVSSPIKGRDQILKRVVLATRTGKVRMMSNSVWKLVEDSSWGKLPETFLTDLISIELIVPEGENELNTVLNRNRSAISDNKSLYIVVQPTASCQLGCDYCGQNHTSKRLSKPAQDLFVQRIKEKLEKNGQYQQLTITWFGAEPLSGLSVIRRMSPLLQEVAAEFDCSYRSRIVTNGINLSKDIGLELVNEHVVQFVEITLDGSEDYHDARRQYKKGNPSYRKIFDNVVCFADMMKDKPVDLSIRCNVDKRNFSGVSELISELHKHNLQDKLDFYVAPVHSWGNDAHLQSLTTEEFAKWEINWFVEMIELGFRVNLVPKPRPILCMAVQPDSELIDAYGNLFNCTEVSYVSEYGGSSSKNQYAIGHVAFGEFDGNKREILGAFNDQIEGENYQCHRCEMLPTCGGMCPKLWQEGLVPCPTPKFNINERLILLYALKQNETLPV